jgi:hypothetical protein
MLATVAADNENQRRLQIYFCNVAISRSEFLVTSLMDSGLIIYPDRAYAFLGDKLHLGLVDKLRQSFPQLTKNYQHTILGN